MIDEKITLEDAGLKIISRTISKLSELEKVDTEKYLRYAPQVLEMICRYECTF